MIITQEVYAKIDNLKISERTATVALPYPHYSIMDLERARDELMYEVHKLNSATAEKDKKVR